MRYIQKWKLVGTIGRYVLLKYEGEGGQYGKHTDTVNLPPDTSPELALHLETELNAAFVAGFDTGKQDNS